MTQVPHAYDTGNDTRGNTGYSTAHHVGRCTTRIKGAAFALLCVQVDFSLPVTGHLVDPQSDPLPSRPSKTVSFPWPAFPFCTFPLPRPKGYRSVPLRRLQPGSGQRLGPGLLRCHWGYYCSYYLN